MEVHGGLFPRRLTSSHEMSLSLFPSSICPFLRLSPFSALRVFKKYLKSLFCFLFCEMGLKRDDCISLGRRSYDPVVWSRGALWSVVMSHRAVWAGLGQCALMCGDGRLLV